MSLDLDQIKHLSKLARLEISGNEIEKLQTDINAVLELVAKLQSLDLSGVEPTFYLDYQQGFLRADEPQSFDSSAITDAMPDKKDNLLRTPKVFKG